MKSFFKNKIVIIFVAVLIARLVFGWFFSPIRGFDEKFIYLLGLKFATTGDWPFFGPDVVYTESQIPGALQSLMIGIPIKILSIPEAPFLFLVGLSMFSLGFFAWYCSRLFRELGFNLPDWVIWLWVITQPWTFLYGIFILNPSYVIIFSIFFFVGFINLFYQQKILSKSLSYFLMGFSLFTVFQLHLGWVLFLPMIGLIFLFDLMEGFKIKKYYFFIKGFSIFLLGSFVGGFTLFPTIYHYGLNFSGGVEKNIIYNSENWGDIFKTVIHFFYFASYEVITYANEWGNYPKRFAFATTYPLTWIGFLFSTVFGITQIVVYVLAWIFLGGFKRKTLKKNSLEKSDFQQAFYRKTKYLITFAILMVWFGFFFNNSGNAPHKFLIYYPLCLFFSLVVVDWIAAKISWSKYIYAAGLFGFLLTQITIAYDSYVNNDNSYLWYKNRNIIQQAIDNEDYRIYGETRNDLMKKAGKEKPGY